MDNEKKIMIDPLSTVSLLLETSVLGESLGTATGFIIKKNNIPYLITNWHVVTGRNPETNMPLSNTAGIPDQITIILHQSKQLGTWGFSKKSLHDKNGKPIWIEHPKGQQVDVIAIPLENLPETLTVHPLDMELAETDMVARPAMPISIIGFPFAIRTGGFWPIWKTGHIAMDPDIDHEGLPAFLIDATTREGMSGAPVVLRLTGGFQQKNGNYLIAGGTSTLFLGIYSGRLLKEKDTNIGRVWKPHVINEILTKNS